MSNSQLNKRLRLGLALLAGGGMLGLSGPAWAQTGYSALYREDPGTALSRHLKTLADSPRNLSALTGAAKAALDLGDAQAAMTFYARAEEVSPRDGRIKAGIGSAFVAMEQPQPALRFFEEARGLGAPEGEYASDRGLAYDLLGDPVQAQRDYQLAMRTHDNDELRRRLALSKAISGDRAGAIAAIDDQLRRQDRAAWRVRAFVLALTGDPAGATEAARSMMPQQAAAMQPFFARLPSLRPAERAMAVHFGHFPGDGTSYASVPQQSYAVVDAVRAPTITDAGRPGANQPGFGNAGGAGPRRAISGPVLTRPVQTAPQIAARTTAPAQVARPAARPTLREERNFETGSATRRSRGTGSMAQERMSGQFVRPSAPPRSVAPTLSAPTSSGRQIAALGTGLPVVAAPVSAPPAQVSSGAIQGPPAPNGSVPVAQPVADPSGVVAAAPAPAASPQPTAAPPEAVTALASATSVPVPDVPMQTAALPQAVPAEGGPLASVLTGDTAAAPAPAAVSLASAASSSGGLGDLAAMIRSLPDSAEPAAAPKRAASRPATAGKAAAEVTGRHWVQIASAPDSLVDSEYRRLKRKHSALLSDQNGYRAPMGKSNRVLVGPFASASSATAFVGQLRKNNLTAVTWTSAEGQDVEKLAAK